jgi:hypothetical protein
MINRLLNLRLAVGCLLSLFVIITPLTIAAYNPPPDQKASSDNSKSGGIRGCPEDKIPLTILAPKKYVGQTASVYPTFAWFISNSYEVEFRLFQFDTNNQPKQIGEPITLQNAPGIQSLSLPETQPALTVGQRYLWQIAISCPQGDLIERAEFTVIQMSSNLSTKLSSAKDQLEKSKLYGEAGLWYDSFREALNFLQNNKSSKIVSNLLQNLAKSEEPRATEQLKNEERQEIQKHIDKLKQIATN